MVESGAIDGIPLDNLGPDLRKCTVNQSTPYETRPKSIEFLPYSKTPPAQSGATLPPRGDGADESK
jgi:hypothetical protein